MNIKDLMSGIAVVIDDALERDSVEDDKIFELLKNIEKEWEIPFYKNHEIPSDDICYNILQSASFLLLDWKLWPTSSPAELEKEYIGKNIAFLKKAKDYFVPVFIFTNEDPEDVEKEFQNQDIYDKEHTEKNFIFIERKENLTGQRLFQSIEDWVNKSASVYTLKTWEQAFYKAKKDTFSSMYKKSPSWPTVFWSSYKEDGNAPSPSMLDLINNNMLARMETDIFRSTNLDKESDEIDGKDIRSVLEGASFIPGQNLSVNEVRAGDIFKEGDNYLINIRADCDCVPRENITIDEVELFCIRGKPMEKKDVRKVYSKKLGSFNEKVLHSIVFGVGDKEGILFDFREFNLNKFKDVKETRIGRLIHPYITRIQQRYALYLQRQGLPRIPKEVIGN